MLQKGFDIDRINSERPLAMNAFDFQIAFLKQVKARWQPRHKKAKYRVYIDEFILRDNTIVNDIDGMKTVFINHNVINYIMTTNDEFINYTFETLKVLQKNPPR